MKHLVSVGSVIGKQFNWSLDAIIRWAKSLGFDGVEIRAQDFSGLKYANLVEQAVIGVHLSDWAEWTCVWKGEEDKFQQVFGGPLTAQTYLPGLDSKSLLIQWQKEIELGRSLGAQYFVFHASEISYDAIFSQVHKSDKEVIQLAASVISELTCPNLVIENAPPHEAGVHLAGDFAELKNVIGPFDATLDTSHLQSTLYQRGKSCQTEDLIREIEQIREITEIKVVHFSESNPREISVPTLDKMWSFWEKRRRAIDYILDDHLPVGQYLKNPARLLEATNAEYITYELKAGIFEEIEKALKLQRSQLI